jgi:hypothetical protein
MTGPIRSGHPRSASDSGDPLDAQRVRLANFWALVLERFRDFAHRHGDAATTHDPTAGGADDPRR